MKDRETIIPDQSPQSATFLCLYAAASPHVFAYIFTLLPNWNDAEEVLQETSLALWRSFEEFEPGTNFKAWACKTAFYQVLSFRKRQKRTPVLISHEVVEAVAEEAAEMADSMDDQLHALSRCVKKLKPRDRSLLNHFYGMGLPTKAIASRLERPVGSITKTLTRIRRMLFACVERTLAMEERG